VEEAVSDKVTYDVIYKVFMRELRKHFNQDFWAFFSSWNKRNSATFIFPFMVVAYVSKRFDKFILNRFHATPAQYRSLVISLAFKLGSFFDSKRMTSSLISINEGKQPTKS